MNTFIHTVHSDEWSPQGSVVKLRPLPPTILSTLALHTCSLISFSSLWPLSHPHLFPTSSLMHPPDAANPLCISLLNSFFLPLNILPYQSSTVVLWFLHSSSSSAPFKRLHQTNSIIKVKSELELWTAGFSPQGHFPSGEATVYTGWCAHTGTWKQPHSCM